MTKQQATVYEGRHRLSVQHLLIALIALFVVQPMIDHLPYGSEIETIIFSVVLVAGVNAVGGRHRSLVAAAVLGTPALLTRWLDHLWPGLIPDDVAIVAATLFVSFVTIHLFRFVVAAPQVNNEVLSAAISVFILLAIVWSLFYTLLARWDPNAFTFTTEHDSGVKMEGFYAVYFSVQLITATTFGDIMPVSNIARMTALAESTFGLFYLAILVSRLVGMYSNDRP